MRHEITPRDLGKRHRDRRFEALELLAKPPGRGSPQHLISPADLARHWNVHPSSAYRVLERLRKFGTVERSGAGLNAGYSITQKGLGRLEWFRNGRKGRGARR